MSSRYGKRWWQRRKNGIRKDIENALLALRDHAENVNKTPQLILTVDSTYQYKNLNQIYTTKVQEWEIGYRIRGIDELQGFYMRDVFARVLGGRLDEIGRVDRERVAEGLFSILDKQSEATIEFIDPSCFCIHQPFAVMHWTEKNANIVTPSAELILAAFDPARYKRKGD
jgi:hypothetical protein